MPDEEFTEIERLLAETLSELKKTRARESRRRMLADMRRLLTEVTACSQEMAQGRRGKLAPAQESLRYSPTCSDCMSFMRESLSWNGLLL